MYLTPLPGGPPTATFMLCSGWSMDKVKDVTSKGDQYSCGCCLTVNFMLLCRLYCSLIFSKQEDPTASYCSLWSYGLLDCYICVLQFDAMVHHHHVRFA
jgi:hypothetical protein